MINIKLCAAAAGIAMACAMLSLAASGNVQAREQPDTLPIEEVGVDGAVGSFKFAAGGGFDIGWSVQRLAELSNARARAMAAEETGTVSKRDSQSELGGFTHVLD